jgi:UDP-N-acetylmuramoylalanine--D-glutamate ligase
MPRHSGQRWLVIGLGKSGTAAWRYLLREGAQVVLTDSRAMPPGLEEARAAHLQLRVGGFSAPEPYSQFRGAVLSPGVSPKDGFVQRLVAAGLEIVGDVELFARAAHAATGAPVVGITGANGKSTVTTLVGEMARKAGLKVAVGGNLGTPALSLLGAGIQLYVLELSSFQLETTRSLRCKAATVLNLSQDHLDRHGTMEAYAEAKARIYNGCEVAAFNRDDAETRRNLKSAQKAVSYGLDAPLEGHYGLVQHEGQNWLACGAERLILQSALKIYGLHNASNALAAIALADAAGIPREASLAALAEFRGLRHRCEFVAKAAGAAWFNDSKGTNVGSTLAALKGLPGPIVWLGGGQGKGQDFSELARPLAQKGRAAILFGQDAEQIERDILGALPVYREATLGASIRRARELAQTGDRVLLSPACASLDQFKNYEDRGEQFCASVRGMSS